MYLETGRDPDTRPAAYRAIFRTALDEAPVRELRMALNQDQPIGNDRFYAQFHSMTGQNPELRKRGRPKTTAPEAGDREDQMQLALGNAQTGILVALAVVLHNAVGLAAGYWFGLRFTGDPRIARTLAIEVGMQNSGLAVALAVK